MIPNAWFAYNVCLPPSQLFSLPFLFLLSFTVCVKKTFQLSFNTIAFGFAKTDTNGTVIVHISFRFVPFRSVSFFREADLSLLQGDRDR